MRFILALMVLVFSKFSLMAQDISSLPVVPFPAKVQDTSKPLIIYISGDGGMNSFSKDYVQYMNEKGYPVVFFNSFKYFFSKKTPQQAAADVEKTITHFRALWKRSKVLLIGYSFGADVLPFVYTRISKPLHASIKNLVLISPSNLTDFEVHVKQLFGNAQTSGVSVPDEINRINDKSILIVQAEKEEEKIETSKLKIRNFKLIVLKGGHRYDHDVAELANVIFESL